MTRRPGAPWRAAGAGLCLLSLGACAQLPGPPANLYPAREYASVPLPNCRPELDRAEYWLAKWSDPDHERLSAAQVAELNREIVRAGLITNVFSPTLSRELPGEPDRPETENGGPAGIAAGNTPLVRAGCSKPACCICT